MIPYRTNIRQTKFFVGQNFRRTKFFVGQNFRHQAKISTILSDNFLSDKVVMLKMKAEDCKIEKMDCAPLTHDANLTFKLHRVNEG